jgi:hypothetical protein
MFSMGTEPSIPASERHQTHASDRTATANSRRTLLDEQNQGWNMLHVEGVENLQQLKEKRRWEEEEADGKD